MQQASETLAGRVEYIELAPFDVLDLPAPVRDVNRLWVRGGFPESVLAASDASSLRWRHAFIRSYLERDVPMFAPRLPAETIGRLWTMLAHAQGTLLNQSRLASSLAVSTPTIGRYIDLLVDLLLVRRLRPWSGNAGKRLVRTPKIYLRDSGLVHALLDLEHWDAVLGHPVAGPSWEGFVVDNLIAVAGDRRAAYFYAPRAARRWTCCSSARASSRWRLRSSARPLRRQQGLPPACDALRPKVTYVVHGGEDTWPLNKGSCRWRCRN